MKDDAQTKRDLAVQCRDLTKTYGSGDTSIMALRSIDLDLYCGELLTLVGPSGCGKTTLISIIATIALAHFSLTPW